MTQLARLAKLAFAPELTPGVYSPPTVSIPWDKADFEDEIAEIKDESMRANDTVLQGMYAGPAQATWSIDVLAYPDLLGHFLRGIIGPDTVVPGISTALAGPAAAGAPSFQVGTTIPAGSTVKIDSGPNAEYVTTGPPTGSGSGPFTVPVAVPTAGLAKQHAAGTAVLTAATHTFKQDPTQPKRTFSISVDDTTNNPLGYASAVLSDLAIKIDPKGAVSLSAKFTTMPGAAQPAFVPAYVDQPPLLGWQWTMQNAGGGSTRGLTLDLTVKRTAEAVHSSTGTQGPREVFQGALEADFSYKTIHESQTDLNLFLNYIQLPVIASLVQPPSVGGSSLAITLSRAGVSKGKRELGNSYVQASFSGSGIYNVGDGGAVSAVLKNFVQAVY